MFKFDTSYTSPLVLADKLIGIAQLADHAGYAQCAEELLTMAFKVLDGDVSECVLSASLN